METVAAAHERTLDDPTSGRLAWLNNCATQLNKKLSRETSTGRFIPELDGLRFVAIAMVILFHLNGYLTAKTSSYEPGMREGYDWLYQTAVAGAHGVELFFVISGFILALPFAAHHLLGASSVPLRAYYLRRLTRLEPPYFITIFLLMSLGAWVGAGSGFVFNPHLAASLFYLHNIIYGAPSTVLGVAWSLEIEVQFYLLVPLLTLIFAIPQSIIRRCILCASMIPFVALRVLFLHGHQSFGLSIAAYLQYFLLGFLLADIFLLNWNVSRKQNLVWDVVALIGWPSMFWALQRPALAPWLFPGLIFALFYAAFRGKVSNSIFSNRLVTVIGGMCYSIYLIHYEIISAVARVTKSFGENLPAAVYLGLQLTLVGAAIVIVCGLYFLLLEKPCMRRDWPQRLWACVRDFLPLRERQTTATAES